MDIGDTPRAEALFAQAARDDRYARNWATLLPYARLQTSLGEFAEAKKTLRAAFSVPANVSYPRSSHGWPPRTGSTMRRRKRTTSS